MELNLQIGVQCKCGAELTVEETTAHRGEVARFKVKPCADCIALAIEEATNKEMVSA